MRIAGIVLLAASLHAQVKLPPHSRRELANGTTLITIPKRDVPLVSLLAVFRGGLESDPSDRAGLAAFTAEMLGRGAGSRSAEEFADAMDQIGATFRVNVDGQATLARMEFLARHSEAAVGLFADALIRPRFDATETTKALAEKIDGAKSLKDRPDRSNQAYFRAFFFGPKHPYGRAADELTLAGISVEQVRAQHRRMASGRNLILVAAGDVGEALSGRLERAIAAMPAGERHSWIPDAPAPKRSQARLLLVDKPDATQTYFLIAQPGIHRTHPDRTALDIVNTLFGGRFTSMLNDALRVDSGLTYGASSSVQMDRLPGAIAIRTFTKTETTVQAMDLALEILKRLRDKGITADQLASAKTYIKGQFPTESLETADQVAAAVADIELHGLNRGEVDDLFSRIDAVTLDQANAVARTHYRVENLQFCLTGSAAKIRDQVAKYAAVRKEISISTPGVVVQEF
jgi:predicted Zn-dependent peptidase